MMQKRPPRSTFLRMDAPDAKSSVIILQGGADEEDTPEAALDACADAALDVWQQILKRKRGADVAASPSAQTFLRDKRDRYRQQLEADIRAQGIAPGILKLFDALTKRDAEKVARSLTITKREWANLVMNARKQIGYRHKRKIREFSPVHHEAFSEDVSRAFASIEGPGPAPDGFAKAMRKANALHDEKKTLNAHMFWKGSKWHCFYFDFSDLGGVHHTGPHLHSFSHRWDLRGPGGQRVTRDEIWAAFDERHQTLPREHIAYLDESAPGRWRQPGEKFFGTGEAYHVLKVDHPPIDSKGPPATKSATEALSSGVDESGQTTAAFVLSVRATGPSGSR